MKALEEFKTIETYINDKLEKKNKELIEIKRHLKEIESKIETYEKARDEAEERLDGNAYAEAKQQLNVLNTSKEMYEKRLNKISGMALVSREEYDTLVDKVKLIADKSNDEINIKAEKLLPEFEKLAKESIDIYDKANSLLHHIEKDLGNDSEDFKKSASGAFLSDRFNGLNYKYKRPFNVVYSNIKKEVELYNEF